MALAGPAVVVVGKFLFKRAEKAYEEKVEEVMEVDEEEISSGSKFCPECGAKLPIRANFCNKCGKNFD
jgi:ribosomal protein L40E